MKVKLESRSTYTFNAQCGDEDIQMITVDFLPPGKIAGEFRDVISRMFTHKSQEDSCQ